MNSRKVPLVMACFSAIILTLIAPLAGNKRIDLSWYAVSCQFWFMIALFFMWDEL